MTKRLFDVIASLLTLIVAMPLIALVALLIKVDSKGPIFFKQVRVGRYGQCYYILKFRSMVIDADKQGPYYTRANDIRITRVGRLIRRTSLDELPQLLNVIRGDMSLVGPRPNVPKQEEEYTKGEWDERNIVRPGITGLAQAKLRSAASPDERTKLDLEYVNKCSLSFDMYVILLTIKQVFTQGGN